MGRILLKNILLDDNACDILIEDCLISKIHPHAEAYICEGAEIVDCTGKAAVPGFVNSHTHSAMTLMRGVGEDVTFSDWIDIIWKEEKKIDDEYIYLGTKIACIEMIKTGTTTFYDQYWRIPAAARAVREMGLRGILSYVHLDRFDLEEAERQKEECDRTYRLSEAWGGNTVFSVAIHSVYSVLEDHILWAADYARKRGLKLNVHLCETEKEVQDCLRVHGVTPVKYLDDLGVLGPDVIAAHTLWLSPEDIEILARRKVNCVHNINSNLKLASGYRFPYMELKDAGVNICLGTDGCASSNNLDMLEAMKTAAIVQKAWRGDPAAMPLDELLAMATRNGADALGLDCGSIAEGRIADILIVDMNSTFFLSNTSFLANFVYSAHSDSISSVICNGKFIMRDRKVEGEEQIKEDARRLLERVK